MGMGGDLDTAADPEDTTVPAEDNETETDSEDETEASKQKKRTRKTEAKTKADELGKSNDPVRIYLRKMGRVALLSREGEIVIAKKIEEEENKILNHIFQFR